jgi:hypothetical protein
MSKNVKVIIVEAKNRPDEAQKWKASLHYFTGKLTLLNYNMAVHEGDATRRLASQAVQIKLIPSDIIPVSHRKKFNELSIVIDRTLNSMGPGGLQPYKMRGIRNSTATKYIKLLWEIQDILNQS